MGQFSVKIWQATGSVLIGNHQVGIADLLKPVAGLYCSDPLGKWGHPGAKVRVDFAGYHPVQVDGMHGWKVEGTYRFL